jgi:NADH-quinone oxidoreductase subunit N
MNAAWNLAPIMPAIFLSVGAILSLTASLYDRTGRGTSAGWIAVLSSAVTLVYTTFLWQNGVTSFAGMAFTDEIGRFFCSISAFVALMTGLTSLGVMGAWRTLAGEYHALVLLGAAGMTLMVTSEHLVVIFFGLETLSLCLYALVGYRRSSPGAIEASMKYFLLGSVASAILLYGLALLYGAAGGLSFAHLARFMDGDRQSGGLFFAGLAMLVVGFGFKIAVVPFHMWVPDVYQGSPTPITGFMATGVKAAGFAVLLRVFPQTLAALSASWTEVFSVLAILTMVVGNVLAVTQRDVKRLLAYSSIAHAGYLMVALVAAGGVSGEPTLGQGSILFYSAAYAVTNLGAFAALCVLGPGREDNTLLSDYAGLARRRPAAAAAFAIFLFSLMGLPPTAGFAGKFYIFYAAVATGHTTLAVIGVLSSLLSVYYYLRVLVALYMEEPNGKPVWSEPLPPALSAVLAACAIAVLGLGVLPGRWMDLARLAVGG